MADATHSAGTLARQPSVPIVKRRDSSPDAAILAAFACWQALHAERGSLPPEGTADDERPLWNEIDRAETQVHDLPAISPKGVACKLWVALPLLTPDDETEAAAFRTDLGWFVTQGDALGWDIRCIVSALVALESMEG